MSEQPRVVVQAYYDAFNRGDWDGMVALLTEDVTWSMPPQPHWYRGLEAVSDFAIRLPLTACGQWRHRMVAANGQPAVACYLRAGGDESYEAWAVNVLTIGDGRIAAITSFIGAEHFAVFGLPDRL